MTRCRSCGREVRWVLLDTGRRMPIDPYPSSEGNVRVVNGDRASVLRRHEAARERRVAGVDLFLSHFKTCPNAEAHRARVTSQRGLW